MIWNKNKARTHSCVLVVLQLRVNFEHTEPGNTAFLNCTTCKEQ